MALQPLTVVVRFARVSISRSALEQALGLPLDRYEEDAENGHYAQIDIDDAEIWPAVSNLLDIGGTQILNLIEKGAIATASLDIAVVVRDHVVAASCIIPRSVVEAAGRAGMELEVSIYRGT